MENIKCITFDKETQNNLPDHIKAKMKADRERARRQQLKEYECTDCGEINKRKDNGEINVGFCSKCGHPLWNDVKIIK